MKIRIIFCILKLTECFQLQLLYNMDTPKAKRIKVIYNIYISYDINVSLFHTVIVNYHYQNQTQVLYTQLYL